MDLKIDLSVGTEELHTDDYFKVQFSASNYTPQGELLPCKQLTGMKARILFHAYQDQPGAGEIISVELRE